MFDDPFLILEALPALLASEMSNSGRRYLSVGPVMNMPVSSLGQPVNEAVEAW